jgi:arginyl-tRNA synthetase
VLEKSSGDVTYLGNDLAYHFNIFEQRKFDRAIKVWGADHAGQVPSLRLAVGHLFPDKFLDFVILQWVRLMRNGQEVKMSKRAGTYVTVEELIDEVGSDVARFFFLMRSADTAMDFDLDLAKEQSQKNPLFYVMYSYARANSIMEQAKLRRFSPVSTVEDLTGIEKALIRQISQLPQILEEIRQDYGVHRLTFFGIETAKLFHDLYEAEKIIDLDKAEASKKLYLIQQYITFMEVYFSLLGVTPVKKMVRGEE